MPAKSKSDAQYTVALADVTPNKTIQMLAVVHRGDTKLVLGKCSGQ